MQGVIKAYDPNSGLGVVTTDTDLTDYELAPGALAGSVFRFLRQGQRVVFDLDAQGLATHLRLGSEVDMATPGFPVDQDLPGIPAAPTAPASSGIEPGTAPDLS